MTRAELPKGFRDYSGQEVTDRNRVLSVISGVYRRYGFDPLETSAVEGVDALGKFLPDVDRPNAGIFAWKEGEQEELTGSAGWLALRYDMTAPLARFYAQFRDDLPSPYRRYSYGPVWRNEKPGIGRYRQFYQCDADTVGSSSPISDAEICLMVTEAIEATGIQRGDYVLRINNRKVLNGVLEKAFISPDKSDDVLRTIDKMDKVGEYGVRLLLTEGLRDESGSFIQGVGLRGGQAGMIIDFLNAEAGPRETMIERMEKMLSGSAVGEEGVAELRTLMEALEMMDVGPDRAVVDPSMVRGLGYYTGNVFEAELTFAITEDGQERRFGSIAGGGRYDMLIERFTDEKVPATGVSIGVDRLMLALRYKGLLGDETEGPVMVTVMNKERMADYILMVKELRDSGVSAELYLGEGRRFGEQMKYADKRGSSVAVICGDDEFEGGVVLLKDLNLGRRLSKTASLAEWKAQPAQKEVLRSDLVNAIKAILNDSPL